MEDSPGVKEKPAQDINYLGGFSYVTHWAPVVLCQGAYFFDIHHNYITVNRLCFIYCKLTGEMLFRGLSVSIKPLNLLSSLRKRIRNESYQPIRNAISNYLRPPLI